MQTNLLREAHLSKTWEKALGFTFFWSVPYLIALRPYARRPSWAAHFTHSQQPATKRRQRRVLLTLFRTFDIILIKKWVDLLTYVRYVMIVRLERCGAVVSPAIACNLIKGHHNVFNKPNTSCKATIENKRNAIHLYSLSNCKILFMQLYVQVPNIMMLFKMFRN